MATFSAAQGDEEADVVRFLEGVNSNNESIEINEAHLLTEKAAHVLYLFLFGHGGEVTLSGETQKIYPPLRIWLD